MKNELTDIEYINCFFVENVGTAIFKPRIHRNRTCIQYRRGI